MNGFFHGYVLPTGLVVLEVIAILVPLLLVIAYYTYAERKVLAYSQLRKGPNVVGPLGLLQPIADGLKMLLKETVIPSGANRLVFIAAPIVTRDAGARRLGGDPIQLRRVVSNINVGILYLFAISSLSVYGIDHGRLGVELALRLSRCAARRGADGVVRSLDRLRAGHRAVMRRLAEPDRDRRGAAATSGS